MTLDLAAQLAAAQQEYLDNADWQTTNSVAKASIFVAACNKLLLLIPSLSRSAGRFEIQFNVSELRIARESAQQFVAAQAASNSAFGYTFQNSR